MSNLELDLDFDLDKEVQLWCRAVHRFGWNRQARIAELADHLHCEIERLQSEGLSERAAFRAATEQLGDVGQLQSEHIKNATILSLFVTTQPIHQLQRIGEGTNLVCDQSNHSFLSKFVVIPHGLSSYLYSLHK